MRGITVPEGSMHESPETPVEELIKKSYWGLVNTVNDRLSHLPPATRHNVTAVHFKLEDDPTGLTDVIVGRTCDDCMVPVELRGQSTSVAGEETAVNVHLRPEASTPVPADYHMLTGLIYDHLDALETAKATATVTTEITL